MPKTIIFCADGTWNSAAEPKTPSNVLKLFRNLAGEVQSAEADNREIEVQDKDQIAKYINGVGSQTNLLAKHIEGITGNGVVQRIVRGYTFISRCYDPGDDIVVVGFSRGAYTARALAGLIAAKGLLEKNLEKEEAYDKGIAVWCSYKGKSGTSFLSNFFQKDDTGHLRKVDRIKAVAVWDTVGAIGIPDIEDGKDIDRHVFADTILNEKVERGFHAIARDEHRVMFTPIFWNPSPGRIDQVIFSGAHADVGGGYPLGTESSLSDIALTWMMDNLRAVGVRFKADAALAYKPKPDPLGPGHQEWRHQAQPLSPRLFPAGYATVHSSLEQRRHNAVMLDYDSDSKSGKTYLYI